MINNLNRLRIYTLLLTLIFFISSCITPPVVDTNSKKVNKVQDRKEIFVNGKKTAEIIFPKNVFRIKDAGVGCPQAGFEIFSVGNCNESFILYQNNSPILTLNQPSVGQYQSYVGCDCGVNYNLEFKHIINGCGINTTETVGSMNLFYPCPNETRPSGYGSPNVTGSSASNSSGYLPTLFDTNNQNNNGGNGSGGSGSGNGSDCDDNISPDKLGDSGFSSKNFSSLNVSESLEELTSKIDEIKKLQSEYDNLNARGDVSKRDEINTQLQNAITQRNSIKQDILTGLNSYKFDLRNKVNILLQNPSFSVDNNVKPVDLFDYKNQITDIDDHFYSFVISENTEKIILSMSLMADENKLLIDLLNDYSNNTLSNLPPITITDETTDLDKLLKPLEVINYLANQITYHRELLKSEILKTEGSYEENITNLWVNQLKQIGYFSEKSIERLIEKDFLNPETGEINLIKINNINKNVFGIQSSTWDYYLEKYTQAKTYAKEKIQVAVDYYKEPYNKYVDPAIIPLKPVASAISKEIANNPVVKRFFEARTSLNNLIKKHGTDKLGSALAATDPDWDTLSTSQQQSKILDSQKALHEIINIDTTAIAGLSQITTLKNLVKATTAVRALELAKSAQEIAKLEQAIAEATGTSTATRQKAKDILKELYKDEGGSSDFIKASQDFKSKLENNVKKYKCTTLTENVTIRPDLSGKGKKVIAKLKSKHKVNTSDTPKPNVATGESVIGNKIKKLDPALSGEAPNRNKYPFVEINNLTNEQRILKTPIDQGNTHHSEVKILEKFAQNNKNTIQNGTSNLSGEIKIFTEQKPCVNCPNVFNEFSQTFPNIKLLVEYGL